MTTTSNRLWPALTALTGLGTLAVTVSFRGLDAVRAAGPCMDDGSVLRFELATTMAQLGEIFGPPTCAPLVKAGMNAVNHHDIAFYIPTYTAFCVCAAIWLGGRLRAPLVLAAIGAAAVAFVADMVETTGLLQVTKDLAAAEPLLGRISTAAWIKFWALAVQALLLAAICLRGSPRRLILGLLLVLPVVGTGLAFVNPERLGLMTLAFVAAWTPMMLLAIRETIRVNKR